MKILLAPSETKRPGGDQPFRIESLLFYELLPLRQSILLAYINALQRNDPTELSKMFGLKRPDDVARHAARDIPHEPTMPAIERYTGVAFDHLDYPTLSPGAKTYLDQNLILHSNLFGFLRASDPIPEYRLKQGEPIGDMIVEKLYRDEGTPLMDAYLGEEDLLDLRAGFYERVYKPQHPHTVLKFLKGDKVVSHWAKAYRGLVLRAIAEAGIDSMEAFMRLPIKGLSVQEIQTRKHRTEIIYQIEERPMKKNAFEMGATWEDDWSADNKNQKKPTPHTQIKPPEQHRLRCSKEKRRGKVVTIVQPFYLEKTALQSLLKILKKRLGTGGTIKENALELQGDIATPVQAALEKEGYFFVKKSR